jgi:hypothetical protein
MSTTTPTVEDCTDSDCDHRDIDHARFVRGCTEDMTVTPIAPHMFEVSHNGETYMVDLRDGVCDCPDSRYRNTICKHLLRAAIVAIYAEGVTTELVARVASHAATHACPAGNDVICSGPTGPELPCPDCIEATGASEWTVWQQTAHRTGARR